MKKFGNILWGLVFIVIGLIFGLNALEITDINIFFDGWWTLIIIIPSFIGLFTDINKTSNIMCLLIGILLLLSCRGIMDFNLVWKLLVPIILVIVGLSLIFKDTINSKLKTEIKNITKKKKDIEEYCATFGAQNIDFSNQKFAGCELTAVFGGVKCDLKNSQITEDVVITGTSIFGGIDIILPENINVKITSTPIFGGVSNKYVNNNVTNKYTVYINATCIFGGVDIK